MDETRNTGRRMSWNTKQDTLSPGNIYLFSYIYLLYTKLHPIGYISNLPRAKQLAGADNDIILRKFIWLMSQIHKDVFSVLPGNRKKVFQIIEVKWYNRSINKTKSSSYIVKNLAVGRIVLYLQPNTGEKCNFTSKLHYVTAICLTQYSTSDSPVLNYSRPHLIPADKVTV